MVQHRRRHFPRREAALVLNFRCTTAVSYGQGLGLMDRSTSRAGRLTLCGATRGSRRPSTCDNLPYGFKGAFLARQAPGRWPGRREEREVIERGMRELRRATSPGPSGEAAGLPSDSGVAATSRPLGRARRRRQVGCPAIRESVVPAVTLRRWPRLQGWARPVLRPGILLPRKITVKGAPSGRVATAMGASAHR